MNKYIKDRHKLHPKHKEAVALKYNPDTQAAPVIVAVGAGDAAEKMVSIAEENSVPIHHDSSLAHALSLLKVGDEIPQELYGIVAEILIFIGNLDKDYGEKYGEKYGNRKK